MPNQIELKDAQQDQEIALLKHRVEQLEGGGDSDMVDELRARVRKLEKWVWGAGAVISAAIILLGIVMAADAKEMNYGIDDTTKQEVLLQLPSHRDQSCS
jgi:hypothetical protein